MLVPWIAIMMMTVLLSSGFGRLVKAAETEEAHPGYAVLVHGMSRSHLSMIPLGVNLKLAGYKVLNVRYESHRGSVEALTEVLSAAVDRGCTDKTLEVHFVTHSLGGILVRSYLESEPEINLGRVVMLAPPNQGSEIVDKMKHFPPYRWFTGPVGVQLGTGPESVPLQLGPVTAETGVISGTMVLNPFLSQPIDGPNDGKVSVRNTHVEGMQDNITISASHTWLMNKPEVMKQCRHFLKHGLFTEK